MNSFSSRLAEILCIFLTSIITISSLIICLRRKKRCKEPRSEVRQNKGSPKSGSHSFRNETRSFSSRQHQKVEKKEKHRKEKKEHSAKKESFKFSGEYKSDTSKIGEEDSLDQLKPRKQQAKRKQDIGNNLVKNKGEYKTWNVYMESSDFDETVNDEKKQ